MGFKTQPIKVTGNAAESVIDYLVYGCQQAAKLANCATYHVRQAHFEKCSVVAFFDDTDTYRSGFWSKAVAVSYAALCREFKSNPHYQALGGQQAQQVLKSVVESFRSYNQLLKLWFDSGFATPKPRLPGYRSKGALAPYAIPAQGARLNLETGHLTIPISRECKADFKQISDSIELPSGFGFRPEQLAECRVFPRNRELYVEYVYQDEAPSFPSCHLDSDRTKVMGIDPGVSNWLTCVINFGSPFIIDGQKVKSLNQWYNKRVSIIKDGKPQGYWDDELAALAEKRNLQLRDAINKAARYVINYALTKRIGVIVFGWSPGVKTSVNLGSKNNQEFVQIPTARLKKRIEQLCIESGIEFIQTEESYTSKASFLDDDFLVTFGAKPESWKPSGKRGQRVKGRLNNLGRGGYETAEGHRINADVNGAFNILRKVTEQLSVGAMQRLAKTTRGSLTVPKRVDVFKALKKSYRSLAVSGFQPG